MATFTVLPNKWLKVYIQKSYLGLRQVTLHCHLTKTWINILARSLFVEEQLETP